MPQAPLTIWSNSALPEPAMRLLREGTRKHRLVFGTAAATPLADADVAFGQPDPDQLVASARLKWVQIDSAGYTSYDRGDLRAALRARGAAMTNSSAVFDDACAQHVLAMMLSMARQLPQSLLDQQQATPAWRAPEHRRRCRLLGGQTALLLGFGSIARRLVELLRPFGMNLTGTRRSPRGDEPIRVLPETQTDALLGDADHVINILPDNPGTKGYFDVARFARMRPAALFYNVGRGATVDQSALIAALRNGQIAGAFLDVTDPEPLPPHHPLWRAPNCFITPHTAGGHHDEGEHVVRHFLDNLRRYERGDDLLNRVV